MSLTQQEVEEVEVSFEPENDKDYRTLRVGDAELIVDLPTLEGIPDSTWRLLAAAPELALVCLAARRFINTPNASSDEEIIEEGRDLLRALTAALALAGVQP